MKQGGNSKSRIKSCFLTLGLNGRIWDDENEEDESCTGDGCEDDVEDDNMQQANYTAAVITKYAR